MQPCEARFLALAAALYLVFGFTTTLYLHRHLTHRALELAARGRLTGPRGPRAAAPAAGSSHAAPCGEG
jgi:hypothetical protein